MFFRFVKYILASGCALVFLGATAQDNDILFTARFEDVPFTEFATTVEQQTGADFFYLEQWVKDIRISTTGQETSLIEILNDVLRPAGLFFTIAEDFQVYLTADKPLLTSLPDYSGKKDTSGIRYDNGSDKGPTNTEQQYIEGRKNGMIQTLVVGQGTPGGSREGVVINGKIIDDETGEPLIGATIYIRELSKGAVTDVDGRFSIVLRPGKYVADFNCMGMKALQYSLDVRSAGTLEIVMEERLIPITEVVIRSDRIDNVRGSQMGFERLDIKTVKEIPVVLGEKDLLQVARMLPGVQSVGEGSSGFNVRGSSADQNMIYVNKVPVYNSSHLFGFFSSFNSDMVKDFSLYKSNLPAKYGGRISSFFDISTRHGNMNRHTARGGISPVTGHIAMEGPVIKNKAAIVLGARSTHSDWILELLEDPELRNSNARFYDLAGSLSFEPDEKNLIKIFSYYSKDRFSLGSTNDYEYSNAGGSINLKHRFNPRLSGDLAAIYGEYAFSTIDRTVDPLAYQHDYHIGHYETRADFTWLSLGSHKLTFGGNIIYYRLNRGYVEPYGDISLRTITDLGIEDGVETSVYIGDEIDLTQRLSLYGGLRISSFMSMGPGQALEFEPGSPKKLSYVRDTLRFSSGEVSKFYFGPEPRISLKYLLGSDNSVKVSYNRIRQFLFMLSNTIAISPTDQWKLCDYNILPPYSDQVSAGYYHDFREAGISTSVEVYHKWVSNIVEYRDGASFITDRFAELEILQGKQKAYGLELMIRKNAGKLNGWFSYTWSRSTIVVNSSIPGETINNGIAYPSNYDRPHNINLVANYRLNRRLSISSNLVYINGRPVTYPVSIYYLDDIPHIHYSARNAYRIPDYFRIDLSFNLEGNLKRRKLAHSYWMLNFYNLTGRKNAYSVYFEHEDNAIQGYKLSIFGRPIITLSWHFKLGNYASD